VGVVEKVDGDGTVQFVDRSSGRIRRSQLNLRRAHLWRDPQTLKRLNSHLRGRRRSDPLGTPRLTGELFAGFGTLLR
jgi:cyanophycinase-like exopeptidase